MENNQQNDENKEEPRYKKIIRKTKEFIKENWKILLIITLLISSVELLYYDERQKSITQSGGFIQHMHLFGTFYQIGSAVTDFIGNIFGSGLLTKILYGIWLVVKNLLTLLLLAFIFMAIPLIPILVFMLIMFFILRGRVGSLKQL